MKRKGTNNSQSQSITIKKKPKHDVNTESNVTHKMDRIVEEITNIAAKINEKISKKDVSLLTKELNQLNLIVGRLNKDKQHPEPVEIEESRIHGPVVSRKQSIEEKKMTNSNPRCLTQINHLIWFIILVSQIYF